MAIHDIADRDHLDLGKTQEGLHVRRYPGRRSRSSPSRSVRRRPAWPLRPTRDDVMAYGTAIADPAVWRRNRRRLVCALFIRKVLNDKLEEP